MDKSFRIAVLHDRPGDINEYLLQELKRHEILWLTDGVELSSKLRDFKPQIVFSIKHSGFPGPYHREALLCSGLEWFHVGGSGTEHLGSWAEMGIRVTNSAGVLAPFHAERAMSYLLALSSGFLEHRRSQSEGLWQPDRFRTLQGQTLLIVGFGQTGQELAKRARAFGMKIIGVTRSGKPHPLADEVHPSKDLASLWSRAQVLSLNTPLSDSTRGLVDEGVLNSLPQGAIVLNASRGAVLKSDDLLESLERGHLGGVWLDVTDPEPLPKESPLWCHPKVLISAHCADQVQDFPLRFARFFVENLNRFQAGEPLLNELVSP